MKLKKYIRGCGMRQAIKIGVVIIYMIAAVYLIVLISNCKKWETRRDRQQIKIMQLEKENKKLREENKVYKEKFSNAYSISSYIKRYYPERIRDADKTALLIVDVAYKHSIDYKTFAAIIEAESSFYPYEPGGLDEYSLAQVRPGTFKLYSRGSFWSVRDNTEAAARYFKDLQQIHRGDMRLSIASYNCGSNRTEREKIRISGDYYAKVLWYQRRIERWAS
jgi:soluble lytic murein transglycosylase-like protein